MKRCGHDPPRLRPRPRCRVGPGACVRRVRRRLPDPDRNHAMPCNDYRCAHRFCDRDAPPDHVHDDEPHDDPDYRAAVNAQHDDNDGPTTVAQLLDSYDHGYVGWDSLIDGIDKRVFESFTRICDAIEDHRARRARLSPAEREHFDKRTTAG